MVPEQDQFDGRFPTVQSPNPENAEALKLAIELANKRNADLVIATDPDCDRMGVAVRSGDGDDEIADREPDWFAARVLPGEETFRTGSIDAGERFPRRDHQDFCHNRSSESDCGKVRAALRRNSDRVQIYRCETRQI